MKRGFTLIELMVASLLLGMLVTIITMIFNQSSIAWNTGAASVQNLKRSRAALGTFHDIRDDLLPGLGDKNPTVGNSDSRTVQYRTVSLWDPDQENALRTTRAFNDDKALQWGDATSFTMNEAVRAVSLSVVGAASEANKATGVSIGIRSLGPDGKPDTEDDISTWPEEID